MIDLKPEFDLSEEEVLEGVEAKVHMVTAYAAGVVAQKARELASQRLKSGLKLWDKGFSVHRIEPGHWVISITGKLANMMEDGIQVDEIRKMILGGNRAQVNKAEGKNYVDVPFMKDANAMRQLVSSSNLDIKKFKSADELRRSIKFSDMKNGGIREENRLLKRVDNIIKSRKEESPKTQFLTIRRVSPKGKPFPENPFHGARVLDELDRELELAFDRGLRRFF